MTQTRHGWHIKDSPFTDEPYPWDKSLRIGCPGLKRCGLCMVDIYNYQEEQARLKALRPPRVRKRIRINKERNNGTQDV